MLRRIEPRRRLIRQTGIRARLATGGGLREHCFNSGCYVATLPYLAQRATVMNETIPVLPIRPAAGSGSADGSRPGHLLWPAAANSAAWYHARRRCSSLSRSASIASGSRPTCGVICGRTRRWKATRRNTPAPRRNCSSASCSPSRSSRRSILSTFSSASRRSACRRSRRVPLGLFFFLFAQFAIYRARRYRLTRTVWRGVRFWMAGSGVSYAWRAGLWTLLVIAHARHRAALGRAPRSNVTRCATRHTATCKAASRARAAPCSRRCGGSGS